MKLIIMTTGKEPQILIKAESKEEAVDLTRLAEGKAIVFEVFTEGRYSNSHGRFLFHQIIGTLSEDEGPEKESHKKKCPNVEKHGDLCKDCISKVEKQGGAYESRNGS